MIATAPIEAAPRKRTIAPDIGLYFNVPFDTYLLWDAASQSEFKAARTMRHLRHLRESVPAPAGPAQSKGTSFHTLLLEPESFGERVSICPVNPKSGESYGRGTHAWDEWAMTVPGKTLISQIESRDIERMASVAREHPTIKMLCDPAGKSEVSAVWRDQDFGVLCKGRFDRLIIGSAKVIEADIKTTANASPEAFGRDAHKFGYVFQRAWYRRGLSVLLPGREIVQYLVPIEDDDGYIDVADHPIDAEVLAVGESEVRSKLAQYAHALKTNQWPGYESGTPLMLPAWAMRQVQFEGNIQ